MKIAYVTIYDASDVHAWSGSALYISRALETRGHELRNVGNLTEGPNLVSKFKQIFYDKVLGKNYLRQREPALLERYARQVEGRLVNQGDALVFSPGSLPIARLKTDLPIVMWTDATFAGMTDFYPAFSNLCDETRRKGHQLEQDALNNCRVAIFSSDWAARTALDNYDVDPAKVRVVPFGANLMSNRTQASIVDIVEAKATDVCKLLFVGVDWYRKGGDIALSVAKLLNARGVRTELHVAGCTPPSDVPSYVIPHGFVSKRTAAGQALFDKLMSESHFMILPSRAECAAVAYAEASSFGLPSLASNVGGNTTLVREDRNGWAFDIDADPALYCVQVEKYMASKSLYRQLALSTFAEYTERLNWDIAGSRVNDIIREFCGPR